jgi:UDP-glucose:(heptosyl)LPS alpha-1,3-glucosyltransferase
MRIALTVGSFNRLGGIERVTVQLALGYRALGHDVTIIATDWDPTFEGQFKFVRVNAASKPAWLRTLTLPSAVTRQVDRGQYDFVHGQGTSTYHCDLLTFHSVHAAWVDVSVKEEGVGSLKGLLKKVYPFHRAAIATERHQVKTHKGMIHACSKEVRDDIIRYYNAPPEQVVAIPWGIDLEHFRPDSVARAATRASWGSSGQDLVLLLVANELHRKGLGTILDALALLARPEIKLVVAGRADPAPFRDDIERLGLTKNVQFLGHVEVAPCYQSADLFVMPSTYEGWGLVLGEALACGLPVVTSRSPGGEALIKPGRNGLLLNNPRDPAELADAIEQALVPETHDLLAAGARPSVTSYGWLDVSRRLLALGTGRRG